jgi:hypothetical protein
VESNNKLNNDSKSKDPDKENIDISDLLIQNAVITTWQPYGRNLRCCASDDLRPIKELRNSLTSSPQAWLPRRR